MIVVLLGNSCRGKRPKMQSPKVEVWVSFVEFKVGSIFYVLGSAI